VLEGVVTLGAETTRPDGEDQLYRRITVLETGK